ncbi:hypothetical protein E5K00_01140 [Hymenobacter aquaticus]|uniref:Uncharacterized protein n=1 Tax=Hymenobacter aquaticus TaxID=1867101 RepID=A0A4Z0Q1I7_9BACT|nr:hypothetical protein [Hymenobacter aquaticus]TGE23850.1 hypothetical protein E5K00_01140 [Hymenobacter aquaticus]
MKLYLSMAVLVLLSNLNSCKTDRSNKVLDPVSPAAAKAQLDVLRDSVDSRWTRMTASDDAKIKATAQVLQALEKQPGADKAQLKALVRANNQLLVRRYDQQSMSSSPRIDAYDTAQDSVLRAVYTLAQPAAGQPDATVQQLTTDIQTADSEVVGYRLRYDQAAKQFNNYLQLHQEALSKLGGKYKQLQQLPLFELKE